MRWGLIPGWWKKTAKEVPSTLNARAETVAEKPMFRSAFNVPAASCRRRAITSADWPGGRTEHHMHGTLRANDDETTCREFTLGGIGQTSSGYAPNRRQQDSCSSRR
jgi:hypothetical protein